MQTAVPLACFLSLIRPPGVQFENALLQIAPVDKAKCPYVRDHSDIEFRLYTRHNPQVYETLQIDDDEKLFASSIDFHQPTVIYFHAFMETPDDGSALAVREAYVLRGDSNIIIVDASRLEAGPWYFTAAENTWYIGRFAAQFIDWLVSRGLNLKNTHLVGHSLGAQAAGVAGAALKTGRVSRITGLDPALPLFAHLPKEQQLDQSDADFVDVIHTDAGIFGVNYQVGHADFYPNGGISPQPGCELEVVIPEKLLLNKCEGNPQTNGFYTFYLTPKENKSRQKLERNIYNFITFLRTTKSNSTVYNRSFEDTAHNNSVINITKIPSSTTIYHTKDYDITQSYQDTATNITQMLSNKTVYTTKDEISVSDENTNSRTNITNESSDIFNKNVSEQPITLVKLNNHEINNTQIPDYTKDVIEDQLMVETVQNPIAQTNKDIFIIPYIFQQLPLALLIQEFINTPKNDNTDQRTKFFGQNLLEQSDLQGNNQATDLKEIHNEENKLADVLEQELPRKVIDNDFKHVDQREENVIKNISIENQDTSQNNNNITLYNQKNIRTIHQNSTVHHKEPTTDERLKPKSNTVINNISSENSDYIPQTSNNITSDNQTNRKIYHNSTEKLKEVSLDDRQIQPKSNTVINNIPIENQDHTSQNSNNTISDYHRTIHQHSTVQHKEATLDERHIQTKGNTPETNISPEHQEKLPTPEDKTSKSTLKRQKRFLSFFKRNEAQESDNFLFKMLEFLTKNRKNVVPVFTVMREINTLVKSSNGELNHVSKERNNYIGATPPSLIPVTYSLELANENKAVAFVKRLLGFTPKGDRLSIGTGK